MTLKGNLSKIKPISIILLEMGLPFYVVNCATRRTSRSHSKGSIPSFLRYFKNLSIEPATSRSMRL